MRRASRSEARSAAPGSRIETRARRRTKLDTAPADLGEILRQLKSAIPDTQRERMKWIKANVGKQIRLIDVNDVLFFQSDTKYTRVVVEGYEALVRIPLKDLLGGLDPDKFWQIHRGTLVNVERIREVHPLFKGSAEVVLHDGTRLDLSRRFRVHAWRALGMS